MKKIFAALFTLLWINTAMAYTPLDGTSLVINGSGRESLNVANANTWTAIQTFTNSDLKLLGSSTGAITFTSDNASGTNYTLHFPAANDTLAAIAAAQVFTNKTYDTAGSGNVFKINGTTITAISGSTATVGTTSGSLTNGHCVQIDASGNFVDAGGACTVGGGGGTVTSGTADQLAYYAGTGTVVSGTNALPNGTTATTQSVSDTSTKIATMAAINNAITGLDWKAAVGYATTANVVCTNVAGVCTYGSTGVDTIDGHTLALNDRVLLKNQSTAADNGVYNVTTAGAVGVLGVLTRASDYNSAAEIHNGDTFFVQAGTTNSATSWVQTDVVTTINTDPLAFSQVAGPGTYTAGSGLTLTGTSFSIGAGQVTNSMLAGSIAASKLVGTDIATVGTLTAGSTGAGFTVALGTSTITGILGSANGGTGNGFTKFSGPSATEKTFTLPNASATVLTDNALVSIAQGGTGASALTQHGVVTAGASALTTVAPSTSGNVLTSNGTDWVSSAATGGQNMPFRTGTAVTTLIATDKAGVVELTGSTARTWDATAVATLGVNWSTEVWNNSTAILTFDPNSGELVDGLTTLVMYPGEHRRISVTAAGTGFVTGVIQGGVATFTSSGSWTRPPGYTSFIVEIMSGGGAGACRTTTGNAGGGGGGVYAQILIPAGSFVAAGSTETVTVGGTAAGVTGNTNGTAGNASSMTVNGTTLQAAGPAAATMAAINSAATGGGNATPAISFNSNTISTSQGTLILSYSVGGDVTTGNAPELNVSGLAYTAYGGASGGASSSAAGGVRTAGGTMLGGAGGVGGATSGGAPGNGTAPGGGGGGANNNTTSGSGAAGQIVIRGVI